MTKKMTDKEAIIALLRQCVKMSPEMCRNTIRAALEGMDKINAEQSVKEASK